jgi:hypothetical protein
MFLVEPPKRRSGSPAARRCRRAGRMSADTSPALRPSTLASMLISRFRSRRLIWFGPVDGAHVGHLRQPHHARLPSAPATTSGRRCRSARRRGLGVPGARARRRSRRRGAPVAHRLAGHQRAQRAGHGVDVQAQVGGASRRIWIATVGLSGLSVLSRSTRPGTAQLRADRATAAPARPGPALDRELQASCRRPGRSRRCW